MPPAGPGMRSDIPMPRLSKTITRGKRGHAIEKVGVFRPFPNDLKVSDMAHSDDHVHRPITENLIGDGHVAAANIPNLWNQLSVPARALGRRFA